MGMEIALMKDLSPFMKIFINEPTIDAAKQTAMVHAKAAGQADQFSAENKAKFDQFINYMWMAAAKDRAAHQATTVKQAQNPIAFKKWLWDTRPDSKYNAKELAMGTEIEMKEHGIPKLLAKKIAKDHLDDIENYYSVLISIKLEKEPNIKTNPRRLKKNPERRETYLPPVKKEKPKEEKERVINYADFNPPRLYKQNYQQAKNPTGEMISLYFASGDKDPTIERHITQRYLHRNFQDETFDPETDLHLGFDPLEMISDLNALKKYIKNDNTYIFKIEIPKNKILTADILRKKYNKQDLMLFIKNSVLLYIQTYPDTELQDVTDEDIIQMANNASEYMLDTGLINFVELDSQNVEFIMNIAFNTALTLGYMGFLFHTADTPNTKLDLYLLGYNIRNNKKYKVKLLGTKNLQKAAELPPVPKGSVPLPDGRIIKTSKLSRNPENDKPKILIIDDSGTIVEINKSKAEKIGFETRVAYQGMDAIALLPWADVICTDGDYPFRDEFYAALFASKKPFIINSANNAKDFKYTNHGEIAYIRKPDDIMPALQLLLTNLKQKKNPKKKSKHKKSCERLKKMSKKSPEKDYTKKQLIQQCLEDAWDYWQSYGVKDWNINDELDLLTSRVCDAGKALTTQEFNQAKKRLLSEKNKWLKMYSPAEMHVLDEHGRMTKKALDMTLFPKEFNKETIIQSVVFDKDFTPAEAKKWLKHFEFKFGDMDTKPNTLRFRQHPPEHFKNYFSKKLKGGVTLTLGTLKKEYPGKYQTFDRKHPLEFGFLHLFGAKKKK